MVYDHQGCIVLEFMGGIEAALRDKMFYLLEKRVPFHGPPSSDEKCKHLRGKIWEFKADPNRGPGIRIPYFREGNQFICTHAFLKDQRKTPPGEIGRAEAIYEEYIAARDANPRQLNIIKRG